MPWCPPTDDIENQKALRLAQTEDPQGRRTIGQLMAFIHIRFVLTAGSSGVLTKPDTLPASSTHARNMWLEVLEGRTHSLKHGYYCTRQPDDDERDAGITMAGARAAEAAFFANNAPWSTSLHQQRLGIDNLIKTLSTLLIHIINERSSPFAFSPIPLLTCPLFSLPKIQSETSRNLENCRKELGTLPPAVDMDPASYMLTLLTRLCDDVQQYVRGSSDTSRLIHQNRDAYALFKKAIAKTTPNFIPLLNASYNNASTLKHLAEGEDHPAELIGDKTRTPIYLNDMRKHIMTYVETRLFLMAL